MYIRKGPESIHGMCIVALAQLLVPKRVYQGIGIRPCTIDINRDGKLHSNEANCGSNTIHLSHLPSLHSL